MIKILNYDEFINLDDPGKMTDNSDISGAVREIIENVHANGDKALYEYTEKFDGVKLNSLIVSEQEIYDAFMHT
ncbi:MAG: histidinol dehydrogenase, partial [Parasporobacterium sp.]|nr:histidinol dehydrogenase [Parasporobacterium sp.]